MSLPTLSVKEVESFFEATIDEIEYIDDSIGEWVSNDFLLPWSGSQIATYNTVQKGHHFHSNEPPV